MGTSSGMVSITWAAQEANPVYPVPVIYDEARFAHVIERSHHSQ